MSAIRMRTQVSGDKDDIQKSRPKRGKLNYTDLKKFKLKLI